MFTLLIGGAGSGKSALAETIVQSLPGDRFYIATMAPQDGECRQRIEKHRRQRAGKAFQTLECFLHLAEAPVSSGSNVLLEDVGNLLANELFDPAGGGADAVIAGMDFLLQRARHVTAVTNDVFCGGADFSDETLRYLRELARFNRHFAPQADTVAEIVCGIPNLLKGETLW